MPSPPTRWCWPAGTGGRTRGPPVLSPPQPATVSAVSPGSPGTRHTGPADTPSQNTHAGTGNNTFTVYLYFYIELSYKQISISTTSQVYSQALLVATHVGV